MFFSFDTNYIFAEQIKRKMIKKSIIAFLLLGLVACTKEEIPTPTTKPTDPLSEYDAYTVVKGQMTDYLNRPFEILFQEVAVDKDSNWNRGQNTFVVKDSGMYFIQIYGLEVDWKTNWGDYFDEVWIDVLIKGVHRERMRGLVELNLGDSAKGAKVYSNPTLDNDLFTTTRYLKKGDEISVYFDPDKYVQYRISNVRMLIYKKK